MDTKRRPRLSAALVFFLVTSAAGPLASIVGTAPLGFAQDGAGLPAAYLIATLVLLCFAVGYAAISRRLVNTGAFYTYIARGIGRPPAIGAAFLAVVAYTVNTTGVAASIGYFISIITGEGGGDPISWIWGSVAALTLVGLVGYRSVTLSARVLAVMLVLGVAVFAVFDVLVLVSKGAAALPSTSWSPGTIAAGAPGLALMFALTCYVGVESAALYSEETRDPERSVPRAIYAAVISLGVFYTFSIWLLVGAIGADQTQAVATDRLGNLVFDQALAYGGDALQTAMALLFVAGAFAGTLAFHNAASRYLFVLGRDRLLPSKLGRLHPRHRSPHAASLVVSAATALLTGVAIVARLDPYTVLAQGAIGLATLGIVVLQLMAAVAIVVYFRRQGYRSYWRTLILPSLGALALAAGTLTLLFNFRSLVGNDGILVAFVPWLLVLVMAAGVVVGLVIRRRRPARYARLAESRLRPQARALRRPTRWTRRYCLVGAGPAGLAMGRRLAEEGVPFDWYERHHDVGGIWHLDRPGGPMYDGLRTISSTYTSAFPDFPMPADYPDYPAWWQIRDYLWAFAGTFGLRDRITFNTAVTWARPDGVGWSAMLTSGESRYYSGIIAAPGTAWHPVAPTWPGQETFQGQIWHSSRYRSPADLAGRRVLVVGSGNSGAEIACDAARAGATTFLSMRRGRWFVPRHIGTVPTDAVLAGVLDPPEELMLPPDPTELVATLGGDVGSLGLPAPDPTGLAGHPTVNGEILNLIGQGWVAPRPAVVEVLPHGVRFADGTEERVDLIVTATGYDRRPPFLAPELYSRPDGRPDLYLNLFSRDHDGLTVLGLSELYGATFPRFDEMARTAVMDIVLRELGGPDWRTWHTTKRHERPDLHGGRLYAGSPLVVDDHAYEILLGDVCDRYGYAAPSSLGGGGRRGTPLTHSVEEGAPINVR